MLRNTCTTLNHYELHFDQLRLELQDQTRPITSFRGFKTSRWSKHELASPCCPRLFVAANPRGCRKLIIVITLIMWNLSNIMGNLPFPRCHDVRGWQPGVEACRLPCSWRWCEPPSWWACPPRWSGPPGTPSAGGWSRGHPCGGKIITNDGCTPKYTTVAEMWCYFWLLLVRMMDTVHEQLWWKVGRALDLWALVMQSLRLPVPLKHLGTTDDVFCFPHGSHLLFRHR